MFFHFRFRSTRKKTFFFDPAMDSMIEAFPTCVPAGSQPKHAPVRYGEYLMERIDKNYHYRKGAAA